MAIWKEPATHKRDDTPSKSDVATRTEPETHTDFTPPAPSPAPATSYTPPSYAPAVRRTPGAETAESVLAAGLNIEGKIEGTGHIRIAGRFNGDVNVNGNLAIERGAKLVGGIHAETVTVGGELEGNITSAARVELLDSGVLMGDLKAGSLIVAAGSRMRGRVEFGWDDGRSGAGGRSSASAKKSGLHMEAGAVS
jgi:cytoskeletal protein CcmA (bactofilin family)